MAQLQSPNFRFPLGLTLLILVQVICVAFFLGDVIEDFSEAGAAGSSLHLGIEAVAALSLLAAIFFEVRYLFDLLRRKSQLERNLKLAAAAVHDVIEAHFDAWRLSPSEKDVATFLVKGLSIAEIAEIRGCAEGTVKAHLNAVYRKSDTRNRGELLSLLIDSMMGYDSEADTAPASAAGPARAGP